jgi:hypothetical protein
MTATVFEHLAKQNFMRHIRIITVETFYPVNSFQFVANISDILFSILTTFAR